jgi:hypothetical protein
MAGSRFCHILVCITNEVKGRRDILGNDMLPEIDSHDAASSIIEYQIPR